MNLASVSSYSRNVARNVRSLSHSRCHSSRRATKTRPTHLEQLLGRLDAMLEVFEQLQALLYGRKQAQELCNSSPARTREDARRHAPTLPRRCPSLGRTRTSPQNPNDAPSIGHLTSQARARRVACKSAAGLASDLLCSCAARSALPRLLTDSAVNMSVFM